MTDLITDKEQAAAFLSLFKHADPTSFIALRGILHRRPPKGASGVVLKESVQADRPDLLDHLWRASNRIANIPAPAAFYAPIATFKTGDSAKTRNTAQGLAASVECDEDAQRSLAKLTAVLGPPTLVVASGGRWTDAEGRTWPKLHLHWRLARPATTNEELTLLYEFRSLARQYVGADATCDPWVHPLRWPGSWHRKEGKPPTLVTVQSATDNDIDLVAAVEALRLVVPNPERRSPGDAEAVPENLLGDPDDIAAAVAVIPNNDRPWQSWKRILLAIWAASEGHGYDVAEAWSAQSDKHDIDTFEDEWDSILFSPPDRIGMGTLVYEAQLANPGWTSPSHERARLVKFETFFEPIEEDQNVFPKLSNISTLMEDEAALQFAEENRGRLRFCFSHGAWFLWVDTHWQRDLTQRAFHWAREKARAMARDEHEKVRVQFGKMAFAAAVERGARADPALAVTADQWDSDPYLLGTPSGTVDLRTGKLRPANPADGITKVTAVAPADTADCPRWLQFLAEATGDDADLIRLLRMWCGYALTGDTREHVLVFLFGDGGNGKSVFLNTLTGVLRHYAVTAAMDTFVASRGDRHSTDLAMLRGARLVTASETEEGRQWAEARIKQLTGSDPVTARFMRQDNFTFVPTFKLTITGNHKPGLRVVDQAARRRFLMIPFTRTPAKRDLRLEEKLRAEWPAILQWMIGGCLDWQQHGLIFPQAVMEATATYFDEQDVLGEWLAERCSRLPIANPDARTATQDLFASWSGFAKAKNEEPGTMRSFSQRLQKLGLQPVKHVTQGDGSRVRGFAGITFQAHTFGGEQ